MTVSDLGLNFGGPSGFPQGRFVTTGVLSDTLTYLKGKHSIKTGGEFRRFKGNNFQNTAGTVIFTTTARIYQRPRKYLYRQCDESCEQPDLH